MPLFTTSLDLLDLVSFTCPPNASLEGFGEEWCPLDESCGGEAGPSPPESAKREKRRSFRPREPPGLDELVWV